jgi:hypothetical protein
MATCTNPLRASDFEKPRQTKRVCLRFSKPWHLKVLAHLIHKNRST